MLGTGVWGKLTSSAGNELTLRAPGDMGIWVCSLAELLGLGLWSSMLSQGWGKRECVDERRGAGEGLLRAWHLGLGGGSRME